MRKKNLFVLLILFFNFHHMLLLCKEKLSAESVLADIMQINNKTIEIRKQPHINKTATNILRKTWL